ncbi:class VI chitin synthase [Coccidioides immitis H538.4]|uniref:chitin synthase n=1 Tax=Coccidioides immitis H538.4 TaxID=396776 RepID=A0A0J8RN18_COCIT|nr:class VI chitin synthase [Coccidioides immitis H538.4]
MVVTLLSIYDHTILPRTPGFILAVEVLDVRIAPKTVIVMPVYKEEPPVLIKAINSVVDCDYPAECIHVFLSFDGDQVDELYLKVVEHLGVPINLKRYPQSIDVTYKGSRITISRFKHGGKRHCQKQTFRLIDRVYENYLRRNDDLFVLFIDSDCILDRVCLQNFMYDMELKPGSKRNMLAMTGVITSTTQKTSLITLLQDMEYIHGQLFERSVESGCGAVTCLPGALTILRFSAFRKMAKYYFSDKAGQCTDLFDFGKCHLGEDRWLTHLFMIGARERYQIQMCTSAFCKTEAVQTFRSLLKQRRRWFLGFITNEVCMLTDARLWFRYPVLCLLRRYKAWLYPMMFILNPFFNWLYMVYGIFTAGQRTWGGPRADAAAADSTTTPTQAAEQAEKEGDELNVKVETFTTGAALPDGVPVHPSDNIEGRFAPPERNSQGYYHNKNVSGLSLPTHFVPDPGVPRLPLHPRNSFDSEFTTGSTTNSICWPRRLESIVAEEEGMEQVYITVDDQQKMNLARQAMLSNASVDGVPFDSVSDQEKNSMSRAQGPYNSDRRSVSPDLRSWSGPYSRPVFDPALRPRAGQSPLRTSSAAEPDDDENGLPIRSCGEKRKDGE